MTNNEVHIGQIIKSVFDESGMTVSELARCLSCERTNVYTIFRRRTVDVELLARLSEILNHNFLEDAIRQYRLDTTHMPKLNLSVTFANLPAEKIMLLAQFLEILEKKP
jgi:transcriptional regulator with XRE-family HTH domain